MFVNKLAERRTVDEERGVELHCIAAGCPERPAIFRLTVTGTPIGFEARLREAEDRGRGRALVWTVRNVGIGNAFYKLPGYRFTDAAGRAAVLALIDEALRVYRFAYGMNVTPVEDVVFEDAAKGA